MIIREAQWEACGECGTRKCVSSNVYGCDVCEKEFTKDDPYLRAAVFVNPGSCDTTDAALCSWACFFKWTTTVKGDYFISLPYIQMDTDDERVNLAGFLKAADAFRKNA